MISLNQSEEKKKKEDNSKVDERARYFPGIETPEEAQEDEDE